MTRGHGGRAAARRPAIRRLATLLLVVAATGLAAEPGAGLVPAAWPLEAIDLRDGRRLEGLLLGPDPAAGDAADAVRFVQVIRPPGRPMSLIAWGPFLPETILDVARLPPREHELLASRVTAFRDGRRRRAAAEEAIVLERIDDGAAWHVATDDFDVTSTAEPATTRSAVVVLGTLFEGLRRLAPPAEDGRGPPVAVRICGSAAEYRDVQRTLAVSVDAPAFYVPARRLLVAGGDVDATAEATAAVDDAIAVAERRQRERDTRFDELVRDLAADLEARGVPPGDRGAILRRTRLRWDREQAAESDALAAARRDNAARAAASREAFRRQLAHEAWHAWADTRLRDDDAGLPLWLDEGLAQIVESAPLEASELRLDAPDPDRLAALRKAFDTGGVPPLADLLRSGQERFLDGHAGREGGRASAYLAAWAVALDVAILRPVLSRDRLRELVRSPDAVAGFERLVGMPLAAYEEAWRRRLRTIRAAAPPVSGDR